MPCWLIYVVWGDISISLWIYSWTLLSRSFASIHLVTLKKKLGLSQNCICTMILPQVSSLSSIYFFVAIQFWTRESLIAIFSISCQNENFQKNYPLVMKELHFFIEKATKNIFSVCKNLGVTVAGINEKGWWTIRAVGIKQCMIMYLTHYIQSFTKWLTAGSNKNFRG